MMVQGSDERIDQERKMVGAVMGGSEVSSATILIRFSLTSQHF